MTKNNPLVSIITVVYNGEKFLEKTIRSVINQSYENIEYIIIDGGSTDKTIEIIKKYEDKITYWISEPDNGIYDAMNKGIKVSNGELIGIINADDWYVYNAIEVLVSLYQKEQVDYVCGAIRKIPSNIVVVPISSLNKNYIYQGMMYPHVGALIKREIYEKLNYFDISYKVSSDFDMALRINLQGYIYSSINQVVAEIMEGGISASTITQRENLIIAIKHGKSYVKAILFYNYVIVKHWILLKLPSFLRDMLYKKLKR